MKKFNITLLFLLLTACFSTHATTEKGIKSAEEMKQQLKANSRVSKQKRAENVQQLEKKIKQEAVEKIQKRDVLQ